MAPTLHSHGNARYVLLQTTNTQVFRHLRERWGVDPMDYLLSLCGDFMYLEFISNSKSGQFFFYSHDRRFMIKTISKSESKFLRKILPYYYDVRTSVRAISLCYNCILHSVFSVLHACMSRTSYATLFTDLDSHAHTCI